jgi:hypothetical protein
MRELLCLIFQSGKAFLHAPSGGPKNLNGVDLFATRANQHSPPPLPPLPPLSPLSPLSPLLLLLLLLSTSPSVTNLSVVTRHYFRATSIIYY